MPRLRVFMQALQDRYLRFRNRHCRSKGCTPNVSIPSLRCRRVKAASNGELSHLTQIFGAAYRPIPGAVIPKEQEKSIQDVLKVFIADGWQVWNVAPEVPLRLFALCRCAQSNDAKDRRIQVPG
jgi:hypothetical protein